MAKKTIWIKGSTIRTMTNHQLDKYEFNVRYTNPDELSDHEILLILLKEVKAIKTRLDSHEQLFKQHGWIK